MAAAPIFLRTQMFRLVKNSGTSSSVSVPVNSVGSPSGRQVSYAPNRSFGISSKKLNFDFGVKLGLEKSILPSDSE